MHAHGITGTQFGVFRTRRSNCGSFSGPRLVSENATFDCSITHLVAAPGQMAWCDSISKPGRQSTCVEVRWPSLWWTDRGWSAFSPENGTFSEFPFHFFPNRVLAPQMCTISWFQTASCAGCVGMVCRWLKSKGGTGLNPFPTRTV